MVSGIVRLILRLYILVLWIRFVLDWVRVLNPRFRPTGPFVVLVELVFSITDPPIKMFRKLLPPIRIGQIQLDLGWMLTLLSCWIIVALLP